jgi:hypothetical protein
MPLRPTRVVRVTNEKELEGNDLESRFSVVVERDNPFWEARDAVTSLPDRVSADQPPEVKAFLAV